MSQGFVPPRVHERFPGGEWLDPVADGLSGLLEFLDRAKAVVLVAAGAVVLLYVGAKVERELMKRRLEVVDGTPDQVDARREHGGRS